MPALSTPPDAEALAAQAAQLTAQIELLTAQKKATLDQLLTLHDLGRVDSKLALPDGWTLEWSAGRQAYDYPADVIELEAQLQAAKEAAVAARRATPKPATPFWTVRKPRPAKEAA
jgi:hypothetical protein